MLTLRTLIQLINTFCSIRCFLNQNSIFKIKMNLIFIIHFIVENITFQLFSYQLYIQLLQFYIGQA